jgi:hypothetical protein
VAPQSGRRASEHFDLPMNPSTPSASPAQRAAATPRAVHEIHYRIATPARGHFPGHHRSRSGDGGFEFRNQANLLDAPDPRRLDLHASLRDPFGNWIVRVYSQRKSIPVSIIADLSASMAFEGARRKLDVLADFTDSLAWSVWRTGDSFGFVGCDETVRQDWLLPSTRVRGVGQALAARLRGVSLAGRSAAGLVDAHRHLSRQRSLVFVVSDFHLPLPQVKQMLDNLGAHDVVPVVLWDHNEFTLSADGGLAHGIDPESGARRLIWWRASLRERWSRQLTERRESLLALFRAARLKPLFIEQGFEADAVTGHFHE